jgi:hypothetical protein
MAKLPKPKRVNFELIPPPVNGATESEAYALMREVRHKWHPELRQARIALAWRKGYKPSVDGHLILGMCVKASDLSRELAEWDFIILLNKDVWMCGEFPHEFTRERKLALLDHELCHAAPVLDKKTLEPKYDERGRAIWRVRKHDLEEFRAVVERHGTYKKDLERFAAALLKKADTPPLLAAMEGGKGKSKAAAEKTQ